MKKLAAACLAAGIVLSFAPVARAALNPSGDPCRFSSLSDPLVEGSRTGVLTAALLLTDDADLARTYTGYVQCTFQTGTNDTHVEADAAVIQGSAGPGPVAVVTGTVTFEASDDEDVYLCTTVVTSGGTVHWDAPNRRWSTDPNVECELVLTPRAPLPPPLSELDPILCPILAIVFPPEGDIVLRSLGTIWDCPPYGA